MAEFPNTIWSMIDLAASESKSGARSHMGKLLDTYWQPMYAHVRYKGIDHEKAEDLVQEFSLQILDHDLLSIADPSKGKFRTLLLTALDRFVVSRFRYETAAKRAPEKLSSLDSSDVDITEAREDQASAAFDRAYALDVIAQALAKMKQECEASNEMARWEVFEYRVVGPMLEGLDIPDYAMLASRLDLKDEKTAMNLLVTSKRQFTRILRKHIRDYVARSPDVEQYVAALSRNLPAPDEDEATQTAATQITEQAISTLVEEEISSLKNILAKTQGVPKVEIDRSRVSAVYKSGFLARLHNVETFNTENNVYEWGQQNQDEFSDDVLLRSILDTRMEDIGSDDVGTIRDVLAGDSGDVSSIKVVKDWVNLQRVNRAPLFPRDLATAVYYGSIAAALVRYGVRISNLQNAVLANGFRSVLEEDWLDEDLKVVLTQATELLYDSVS